MRKYSDSLIGEVPRIDAKNGRPRIQRDDGSFAWGPQIRRVPTRCHLGGVRWWWICPGCRRRCKFLYQPPYQEAWTCSQCSNLTYGCRRNHDRSYWGGVSRRYFACLRGQQGEVVDARTMRCALGLHKAFPKQLLPGQRRHRRLGELTEAQYEAIWPLVKEDLRKSDPALAELL